MNNKPSAREAINKIFENDPSKNVPYLTLDQKTKVVTEYLNNKRLRLLVDDINEAKRRGWIKTL